MYERLEENYRQVGPSPKSPSEELWRCKPVPDIGEGNESPEKIFEKAVAVLAKK